jgi:hypothetical protein
MWCSIASGSSESVLDCCGDNDLDGGSWTGQEFHESRVLLILWEVDMHLIGKMVPILVCV